VNVNEVKEKELIIWMEKEGSFLWEDWIMNYF
jgi:hypothetical protein